VRTSTKGLPLQLLTLAGNERLRKCHPGAGVVIPWANACAPILTSASVFTPASDSWVTEQL
jgi:hypothetical protein